MNEAVRIARGGADGDRMGRLPSREQVKRRAGQHTRRERRPRITARAVRGNCARLCANDSACPGQPQQGHSCSGRNLLGRTTRSVTSRSHTASLQKMLSAKVNDIPGAICGGKFLPRVPPNNPSVQPLVNMRAWSLMVLLGLAWQRHPACYTGCTKRNEIDEVPMMRS